MSIKRRIWTLPAVATMLFGVGLTIAVYFTTGAIASINATAEIDYPLLDQTKALGLEVNRVSATLREAVSEGDKKRIALVGEQALKVRERIKALAAIPGQGPLAERLGKEFDDYYVPALSVARIMLEMEQGDAGPAIGPMQKSLTILEADLSHTNDAAQQQFKAGVADSDASVHKVLYTNILVAIVVILSLALVSLYVVRSIWQQLGGEPEYACAIAHAVAAGDLSMEIATSDGDQRSVLAVLKLMQGKLGGIVSDIKLASETIRVASAEIASGNADLSSRTESQASSLEQTASAMETLTGTVRQNAYHARHANQLVVTASDVAVKGGDVVSQVVATMDDINTSARQIVDIISVIDGIAFQTNILALNAAVEAARAGEQGRGFAVVASEVRNLAQRSAAAAKQIKELINTSVEKVEIGSRLVGQAGRTMDEIVSSVKRVTDIMSEITEASQEQSMGIGEIGQAITQMDMMTQQNAALVEQAAAAAASLQDQAGVLNTSLAIFKLSAVKRTVVPQHLLALPAASTGTSSISRRAAGSTRMNVADSWEEF
ncbi:methyl-accepting chemotaxis protein [Pseudoduganella sp. LjRoot289]|uniref:methyl-accepting chemotaxis protein n=1 Tax=Pseudoduganella sp. LjRoot289 TaxID=3342314 RepID=UPI003ECECEA8